MVLGVRISLLQREDVSSSLTRSTKYAGVWDQPSLQNLAAVFDSLTACILRVSLKGGQRAHNPPRKQETAIVSPATYSSLTQRQSSGLLNRLLQVRILREEQIRK